MANFDVVQCEEAVENPENWTVLDCCVSAHRRTRGELQNITQRGLSRGAAGRKIVKFYG